MGRNDDRQSLLYHNGHHRSLRHSSVHRSTTTVRDHYNDEYKGGSNDYHSSSRTNHRSDRGYVTFSDSYRESKRRRRNSSSSKSNSIDRSSNNKIDHESSQSSSQQNHHKEKSNLNQNVSTTTTPNTVVFLTKKQRAELARQQEEQSKLTDKLKEQETLDHRRKFFTPDSRSESRSHPNSDYGLDRKGIGRLNDNGKDDNQSPKNQTTTYSKNENNAALQDGTASNTYRAYGNDTESTLTRLHLLDFKTTELYEAQNQKTLEQIREHYLGLRKEKRRLQKPSEKFRNVFNFEWNPVEDTTRGDSNALYLSRVEPQLLFGRGFRAGIDVREQRRYNNFYDELVKHRAYVDGEDVSIENSKEALIKPRDIEAGDPNKKHWTEKMREEMTERDWRICREDFEIYIKGGRVPPPIRNWGESDLPFSLLEAIKKVGYEKPTPIQMQAIPIALAQRDLIGIAETGSGKTAAFVLPMLAYVNSLPLLTDETSQDGPYALILAPSRELAIQIDEETRKFASFSKVRAIAVVGGRSAEAQAFELRRGAEIVIGTPGRIKDCLERAYTVLSQCNYVVLDEADRMIDLGFEEIVNWILDQVPSSNLKSEDENQAYQQELEAKAGYRKYRLTQMFSATMPPAVERLSRKYLRSAAYISIGDPGAGKRAIEQRLEFLSEAKKRQRLQEILEGAEPPIMIFVNQKKVADVLAKTLYKMGFSAISLHGGKAQDVREQSLADFKSGAVDILVATDVAGRGIDVEGVQLVINFDMPKDIGSYTHRIGRTGRAGRKGVAVSFCTEDDSGLYYDLRQLLISTNNVVPLELSNHPMAKVKPGTVVTSAATTAQPIHTTLTRFN